ncbi:MAG: hypothetical protein OXH15_00805 [Gammaproteobacteria bacterium]|nr:hypothetical protein [Gammaproteobacteria bacterium]
MKSAINSLIVAVVLTSCAAVPAPPVPTPDEPSAADRTEQEEEEDSGWFEKVIWAWALMGVFGLILNASGDPADPQPQPGP